jgi:hypothetical protein
MKRIFNLLMLGGAIVSMSSCLKDDNANLKGGDSPAVVEWSTTAGDVPVSPANSTYPLYVRSYPIAPSIDVPLVVNYTGTDVANDDITLTIGLNTSAIAQYNNERKTVDLEDSNLELIPSNYYTLPTTVVIPKGQHKATIIVKLNSSLITNFDKKYILPVSILSASGNTTISKNYGTLLYQIGAKNSYDGTYRHTYTSTLGNGTNTVRLVTTGANTVRLDPGLLGVYTNAQTLTIDPATNLVTVSMTTLLPITNNPASKYDPATKTFTVKYTSNGGARTFDETYVYTGPR